VKVVMGWKEDGNWGHAMLQRSEEEEEVACIKRKRTRQT